MKILHTIETSGPGGAENFLIRMAQSLQGQYESLVLLIKPGWLQNRLVELGFPVVVEKLHRSLDPSWLVNVARLLKSENVDIVHSHEFAMNIHMSILAKYLGIKHVATVHGKKSYGDRAVRRLAYRIISRHSTVVAVSEDIKTFLVNDIGIKPDRISVIPNGIEVSDYQADGQDVSSIRAELGCKPDDFLICAIGNLYKVKGHRYLIDAMGELSGKHEHIKLVIAGRGEEHDALNELISTLGIEDKVQLLGFRDDVKSILLAANLFVMPSLSEGLPLALLEAMAAKVPVVVTSVGGMPQVISDGVTGRVVPLADDLALAGVIDQLVEDPKGTSRMAASAYDEVVSNYSMQSMLMSYKELYTRDSLAS